MATTYEGVTGRIVGTFFGTISVVVAVGVFVPVAIPHGIVPSVLADPLVDAAPWLAETDKLEPLAFALLSLFLLAMFGIGLYTLGGALFESDYSITIGGDGGSYSDDI